MGETGDNDSSRRPDPARSDTRPILEVPGGALGDLRAIHRDQCPES